MELTVSCHGEKPGIIRMAYLQVRKGTFSQARQYAKGNAIADYDKDGMLLGVEVLGPCMVDIPDKIYDSPATPQTAPTAYNVG